MYVSRLVIKNLGPFGPRCVSDSVGYSFFKDGRHEFNFKQGSIGVFGDNGVGKTSLVDLMFAVITNDFTRIDKTRSECVNNLCADNDEAFVSATIHQDETELCLTRSIERVSHKARYELKINGKKTITSANEGDLELKRHGIERKILDFCVFKRQPGSESNSIDDFLRSTPAARAEAYMSLNETEHCQLLYDTLGDLLNRDTSLRAEIIDNSDELTAQIGQLENTKSTHLANQQEMQGQLMKSKHKATAEEMIKRADRRPILLHKLDHLSGVLAGDEAELDEALQKQESRKKKHEAAWSKVKQLSPKADKASDALKQWDRYQKNQNTKKRLQSEKAIWESKKKALVWPEKPLDGGHLGELQQERADLKTSFDKAKKLVQLFHDTGLTECPTCGTEIDAFEGHLYDQQELVTRAPKELWELDDRIRAIEQWAEATSKADNALPICEDKIIFYSKAIEDLDEIAEPDQSESELQAVLCEITQVEDDCDKWSTKLTESAKKIAGLEVAVEKTKEQLSSVKKELETCTVDDALLKKAKERLQEHTHAELELAAISGRLQGVESQIADKKEQLETLKAKLKRSKKLRRAVKVLSRVRDAYHKQALPQRVAQGNLGLMEGDINKNLALFGDPFWVEADSNLSFQVHKPGEPPHKAERLSGGQKVVLALAFWPAVNSLYRRGLGMMVLDEPTANLDQTNISFLKEALAKLTKEVRGKRQIIMISHADELMPSFDQVFVLK